MSIDNIKMKKLILISLISISLFTSFAAAGARNSHNFHHGKPFASLHQRIADIKEELEALKLQIGDLPPDLAAIDENTSDITEILNDITEIYIQLGQLEQLDERIKKLEQSGSEPPAAEIVIFSGHFVGGSISTEQSSQDWLNFRASATGNFSSIAIRGSAGAGVSCSDTDGATTLAEMLNEGTEGNISCENRIWNVGNSGSGTIELNAGSLNEVGRCSQEATVRPRINNRNWGGIGVSCSAPSQTLEVILTR